MSLTASFLLEIFGVVEGKRDKGNFLKYPSLYISLMVIILEFIPTALPSRYNLFIVKCRPLFSLNLLAISYMFISNTFKDAAIDMLKERTRKEVCLPKLRPKVAYVPLFPRWSFTTSHHSLGWTCNIWELYILHKNINKSATLISGPL